MRIAVSRCLEAHSMGITEVMRVLDTELGGIIIVDSIQSRNIDTDAIICFSHNKQLPLGSELVLFSHNDYYLCFPKEVGVVFKVTKEELSSLEPFFNLTISSKSFEDWYGDLYNRFKIAVLQDSSELLARANLLGKADDNILRLASLINKGKKGVMPYSLNELVNLCDSKSYVHAASFGFMLYLECVPVFGDFGMDLVIKYYNLFLKDLGIVCSSRFPMGDAFRLNFHIVSKVIKC